MDNIAECSLTELVEDPLIGLMMKSDGVDRRSIELLFERIGKERIRGSEGLRSHLGKREANRCTIC